MQFVNYLYSQANKKTVGEVNNKITLKQTQPKIIINRHMSTISILVERNQEKQKQKSEDGIIKHVRNLFRLKKKLKHQRQ